MTLEAVTKLAELLQSRRLAAASVLATVLVLVLVYLVGERLTEFLQAIKAPGFAAILLFAIGSFGASLLLVDLVIWTGNTSAKLFRRRTARKMAETEAIGKRKESLTRLRQLVPHLPQDHKDILVALRDKPAELPYSHESGALTKLGLIEVMLQVHGSYYLYRLTPDTANEINQLIREDIRQRARVCLESLTGEQRKFLQLFKALPLAGEGAEHPFLDPETYDGCKALISCGVLVEHGWEVQIADDAVDLVEDMVLQGKAGRLKFKLDPSHIGVRMDRGSGLTNR